MPEIRKRIKRELLENKISEDSLHIQRSMGYNRRISNHDGETCWLNSSLQMILTALDRSPNHSLTSRIGKELQVAQTQSLIDPRFMKFLIQDEIETNHSRYQHILTDEQCARDLLIILTENERSWIDLYSLLFHKRKQTIMCQNCGEESYHYINQLYAEVTLPEDNANLKSMLERDWNHGSEVEYRCEECNYRGLATKKHEIVTDESSGFFVVLMSRYEGNYDNRVSVTEEVTMMDSTSCPVRFSPVSVIYHVGGASYSVKSSRHYMCDVKSQKDDKWYKTSDSSIPTELEETGVTKAGFIVLYKRKPSHIF